MEPITFFEQDSLREHVEAFAGFQREVARVQARGVALLADASDALDAAGLAAQASAQNSLLAMFALDAHMSDTSIGSLMSLGRAIRHTFVATGMAFDAGEISLQHTRYIVDEASAIAHDPDAVAAYEAEIVDYAKATTPGRTRHRAKQLVALLDRNNVIERHKTARAQRRVWFTELADGMCEITAFVPTVLGRGIYDRLTGQAKGLEAVHADEYRQQLEKATAFVNPLHVDVLRQRQAEIQRDERTRDQLRADLFCDLLLGSRAETLLGTGLDTIKANVNVTISAATLVGADSRPAEHDNYGPLDPDIVRELAGGTGVWTKLLLAHNAEVVSTSAYQPTAEMRRTLKARDQHCRMPGCRIPVQRCEIDHNHDHAKGGETHLNNLAHFCTRHHPLKHPDVDDRFRWHVKRLSPGIIEWQSPIGKTYIDHVDRRVMFEEAPPEPARSQSVWQISPDDEQRFARHAMGITVRDAKREIERQHHARTRITHTGAAVDFDPTPEQIFLLVYGDDQPVDPEPIPF